MPNVFGKERPYLLWTRITQEHKDFKFLLEESAKIQWGYFFRRVSFEYFQTIEPFNMYRLMGDPSLSVYKDYTPLKLSPAIYMTGMFFLYQYGCLYVFCIEGKECWYNKAISDKLTKKTKGKYNKLMRNKLGAPFGDKHGMSTLTEEIVVDIKYGNKGVPIQKVADHYGLSKATVSRLKNNKRWKHI